MTSTQPSPGIPLRSAHDVLAAIPYLLGYRPTESVVLLGVNPGGHVAMLARIGVDDLLEPGAAAGLEPLARAAEGSAVDRCFVAVYSDSERSVVEASVGTVVLAVDAARSPDVWWVSSSGYRGLGCQDLTCCPDEGHPLVALESSEVALAHVLAGRSVAATADEVYQVPRAPASARGYAARAARRSRDARARAADTATLRRWRQGALGSVRDALRHAGTDRAARTAAAAGSARPDEGGGPGPALLGRVAAALTDTVVRDAVLLMLVPDHDELADQTVATGGDDVDAATIAALDQVVDPTVGILPRADRAADARQVLEQTLAHVPRRYAAPVATLLAFLAWWQGDGARAGRRLDSALAADPEYRLAHLVHGVVSSGLPPGWVRAGDRSTSRPGPVLR